MAIVISTDVFCDRCFNWIHGPVGPRVDPIRARQIAHAKGWVHKKCGQRILDLCPECASPEAKGDDGE